MNLKKDNWNKEDYQEFINYLYTLEDKKTLLCVLTTREYYFLRSIALEIDPQAFIFVTKASEVHGEGFTYEHSSK